MKIKIVPDNGAITSVHVSQSQDRLSVLVNTRDKWCHYHRQGGTMHVEEVNGKIPEHQYFLIDLDSTRETGLALIAETDDEAKMLRWMCYRLQDKEQIEFLFVCPRENEVEIAQWPEKAEAQT